jgi:hypothetical protein
MVVPGATIPNPDASTSGPGADAAPADPLASAAPIRVAADERTFIQLIPQFFIFPLVLVVVGVLVYVFFVAAAQDHQSVGELLNEIRAGWLPNAKERPAFELAMRTHEMEREGKRLSEDETRQVVAAFLENADRPKLRSYLLCALGRAGDPSISEPVLFGVMQNPAEHSFEDQVNAIFGLGLSRSPRSAELLLLELDRRSGENDWETRLYLVSALSNLGASPAIDEPLRARLREAVRKRLQDPAWTVRWNSAIHLAKGFGDGAGAPLLRQLLDREFVRSEVPESAKADGQLDNYLLLSIDALTHIRDEGSYALIDGLAKDPSMQVRNQVYLSRKQRAAPR